MTLESFESYADFRLAIYKAWLDTNPPLSEILKESKRMSRFIKNTQIEN